MQSSNSNGSVSDRIVIVDILRAVALFGIIINHAALGFLAGPEPMVDFNVFSSLDKIVDRLADLLTFGKFFAIFSFLFGLSFAIQLDRASSKGAAFSGRFSWRLIVLLAIGLVHGMFFSGDVLLVYALLGLLLIACRKWKNRTIVVVGLVLVLNIPGLLLGVLRLSAPEPSAEQQEAAVQFQERFAAMTQDQYRIKQSGTLSEIIEMNLTQSMLNKLLFMVFTGRLWITFGYFLLGLWAGRVALFADTELNRLRFRRVAIVAGVVAAITSVVSLLFPSSFEEASLGNVLSYFAFTLQQTTLAAFIVATLTLAYWTTSASRWLSALAATGKMGLTTYLMQTVFGVVVFFGIGFGLLGEIGTAASVASGIAFFIAQIFFASWWLRHFQMGPVEWLWRSLTYFKLQPLTRGAASPGLA